MSDCAGQVRCANPITGLSSSSVQRNQVTLWGGFLEFEFLIPVDDVALEVVRLPKRAFEKLWFRRGPRCLGCWRACLFAGASSA